MLVCVCACVSVVPVVTPPKCRSRFLIADARNGGKKEGQHGKPIISLPRLFAPASHCPRTSYSFRWKRLPSQSALTLSNGFDLHHTRCAAARSCLAVMVNLTPKVNFTACMFRRLAAFFRLLPSCPCTAAFKFMLWNAYQEAEFRLFRSRGHLCRRIKKKTNHGAEPHPSSLC